MPFKAPVEDMLFVLNNLCDLDQISQMPGYEDAQPDMVEAILGEAAKFSQEVLAPLNKKGDQQGSTFAKGEVATPEGWREAYQQLVEMGWNSPKTGAEHGGMGLPSVVNASIQEMFTSANTSFMLAPLLTQGAIESIAGFASPQLQEVYLPKLVTGEWTGTMNLTEPQAGSDLAAITSKAVPQGDHYLISGQKIFITYGEHDMSENIIHLVLARLPNAPAGVKGISLFIVPKFMVNENGTLGDRNDVECISIEHKLGIHASPTCTMAYGTANGAIGYLVGEPHEGLKYMFTMMNAARLGVGLQGVGIAEHATQHAIDYAMERKQGQTPQGTAPSIMGHPDIRRMLGLMKSRTEAARVLAYRAAAAEDMAHKAMDAEQRAFFQRRLDLLIPVVKGWSTELCVDIASLGVQIHGGMGFIEETGAAQHFRDARITTIYEGTTGIQALDLVGRKIKRDQGAAAMELVHDMRETAQKASQRTDAHVDWSQVEHVAQSAAQAVEDVTRWLVQRNDHSPQAAAANVLELFGIALGAWAMADAAIAASDQLMIDKDNKFVRTKLKTVAFYNAQVYPKAAMLQQVIFDANDEVLNFNSNDFEVA
ncbi:acyl-CoA dehydrogenase family protein [Maritalea porphyrae]|uniref:acyl-CoA dehydrogenase family protein n=1 Tax=Maritalea porphyrae TaxID=880732 RepID=UPI0022AF9942|nr:acyl-CoA dehydrogenase family protein [Maritalea porphyrae]MCZ4272027.1 acyl-CoA dehydrogenase family protein [Maritalea porphyrae]